MKAQVVLYVLSQHILSWACVWLPKILYILGAFQCPNFPKNQEIPQIFLSGLMQSTICLTIIFCQSHLWVVSLPCSIFEQCSPGFWPEVQDRRNRNVCPALLVHQVAPSQLRTDIHDDFQIRSFLLLQNQGQDLILRMPAAAACRLSLHQGGCGPRASKNATKLCYCFQVAFFLIPCSVGYCKPLAVFQSSDSFCLFFDVSVEGQKFGTHLYHFADIILLMHS